MFVPHQFLKYFHKSNEYPDVLIFSKLINALFFLLMSYNTSSSHQALISNQLHQIEGTGTVVVDFSEFVNSHRNTLIVNSNT